MRDSLQARGYKSLRIKMTAVFFMFFPTIPGRGRWCISSSAQKPSRLPLPRVQFRLLSLSFKVLIPHTPYLVSLSFPPWLSINHSVAGRLTVPHLAFHISTIAHIFVMRPHLWRIPPTAIFRYLHHTHPPRLSTSLLPTKFSLKRYLLVSTSSVNPCSTHSAPEHLLPILPWASSSGLHGAGPPPAPFLCSLPKVPVLTEDALP